MYIYNIQITFILLVANILFYIIMYSYSSIIFMFQKYKIMMFGTWFQYSILLFILFIPLYINAPYNSTHAYYMVY